MLEWIKALENKTLIVFNLVFANNAILSCFSSLFLIIDLYVSVPAINAQNFWSYYRIHNTSISTGTLPNEGNTEAQTPLLTVEAKTRKCSK